MSEEQDQIPRETPAQTPSEPEQAPYIPASPLTRAWAWVGLVYMLLLIFLITYWIATAKLLTGIPSLMLFPLAGGLAATGFLQARALRLAPPAPGGGLRASRPFQLISGVAFTVIAAVLLGLGIYELIAVFHA